MENPTNQVEHVESLDERNARIFAEVKAMNEQGKGVVFAPNHVAPRSAVMQKLAITTDWQAFHHELEKNDLSSLVLAKSDDAFDTKDSKAAQLLHDIHSRLTTLWLSIVEPSARTIDTNSKNRNQARQKNLPKIRSLLQELREKHLNLTIYPYGKWFENGAQEFDGEKDLGKNGEFVTIEEQEKYGDALKPGFLKFAKALDTTVVPVYAERNMKGEYHFGLGEMLKPEKDKPLPEHGKEYLARMRELKTQTRAEISGALDQQN